MKITKLLYLNVIIRTGIAAAVIGALTPIAFNGVQFNWINLAACAGVIILMQGLAQHSLDTLLDQSNANTSSFRGDVKKAFSPEQLRSIFKIAIVVSASVVIVGTLIIGRWLFIPMFMLGAVCIVLYAMTNIESYSFTSFAMCGFAGFLTQMDVNFALVVTDPLLFVQIYGPLFTVFVMLLFIYRIGQLIYRIDDYLNEMTEAQLIHYYRANLRKVHHPIQLGVIALLLHVMGEWELAFIATTAQLGLWYFTHHETCNNIHCHKNRIRLIETKKKPCPGNCISCNHKCKTSGEITWIPIAKQSGYDVQKVYDDIGEYLKIKHPETYEAMQEDSMKWFGCFLDALFGIKEKKEEWRDINGKPWKDE